MITWHPVTPHTLHFDPDTLAQDSGLYTCNVQEKQMAVGMSGMPPGGAAAGAWGSVRSLNDVNPNLAKAETHSGVEGRLPLVDSSHLPAALGGQQHQRLAEKHLGQTTSDDATPSNKSEVGSMQSCRSGESVYSSSILLVARLPCRVECSREWGADDLVLGLQASDITQCRVREPMELSPRGTRHGSNPRLQPLVVSARTAGNAGMTRMSDGSVISSHCLGSAGHLSSLEAGSSLPLIGSKCCSSQVLRSCRHHRRSCFHCSNRRSWSFRQRACSSPNGSRSSRGQLSVTQWWRRGRPCSVQPAAN